VDLAVQDRIREREDSLDDGGELGRHIQLLLATPARLLRESFT
jgi:hypothetical protein